MQVTEYTHICITCSLENFLINYLQWVIPIMYFILCLKVFANNFSFEDFFSAWITHSYRNWKHFPLYEVIIEYILMTNLSRNNKKLGTMKLSRKKRGNKSPNKRQTTMSCMRSLVSRVRFRLHNIKIRIAFFDPKKISFQFEFEFELNIWSIIIPFVAIQSI